MVQNHVSVQLSYSGVLIMSLFDAETKMVLWHLPGMDGKERSPIKKSVRDVLRVMSILDSNQDGDETKHNMWVCLSKGHDGDRIYTGYSLALSSQCACTLWSSPSAP